MAETLAMEVVTKPSFGKHSRTRALIAHPRSTKIIEARGEIRHGLYLFWTDLLLNFAIELEGTSCKSALHRVNATRDSIRRISFWKAAEPAQSTCPFLRMPSGSQFDSDDHLETTPEIDIGCSRS